MEIEHRNYLELHRPNYEMVQNGYVRNIDLDILKMYEHIYRKYMNPDFILTVWCSHCIFDMIKRLYEWYEEQPKPKSLPTENNFYKNVDVSKLKDISDRVEIKETPEGIEVTLKPEPKKRERKPKNKKNG